MTRRPVAASYTTKLHTCPSLRVRLNDCADVDPIGVISNCSFASVSGIVLGGVVCMYCARPRGTVPTVLTTSKEASPSDGAACTTRSTAVPRSGCTSHAVSNANPRTALSASPPVTTRVWFGRMLPEEGSGGAHEYNGQ
jgi:hypothetical protein